MFAGGIIVLLTVDMVANGAKMLAGVCMTAAFFTPIVWKMVVSASYDDFRVFVGSVCGATPCIGVNMFASGGVNVRASTKTASAFVPMPTS